MYRIAKGGSVHHVRIPVVSAMLAGAAFAFVSPGQAQSRADTMIVVSEEGPATLDIHAATANVPTHEVSWNIYDRLVTHARTKLPDGSFSYDYTKFEPELAESWEIAPDKSAITFKLRAATFHDG